MIHTIRDSFIASPFQTTCRCNTKQHLILWDVLSYTSGKSILFSWLSLLLCCVSGLDLFLSYVDPVRIPYVGQKSAHRQNVLNLTVY